MTAAVVFWALSVLAVFGAVIAVGSRDMPRAAGGLGAFLLAIAGFFALYGAGLLAIAEIFLYVGGVLVLVLFAMMLVHRTERGTPDLSLRLTVSALITPAAVAFALVSVFAAAAPFARSVGFSAGPDSLGALLLRPYLAQFETAGILLLAALAAIVAVMTRGDRS